MDIAMVGVGNWGKNLARDFASLDGVNVKYICDLNEKTRAAMGRQYPKTTVTDELIGALRVVRVRSDVERKRLHGLAASASTSTAITLEP